MRFRALHSNGEKRKVRLMTRRWLAISRTISAICGLLLLAAVPVCFAAEPSPKATAAFNAYIGIVEARLAAEHQTQAFLAPGTLAPQNDARLRRGEYVVDQLTPASATDLPGAMLHDWRATAFVAGAKAEDFERMMRDYSAYPRLFSPQVMQATVLSHDGDHFVVKMRVRQHHVITVVMDTTYDVTFRKVGAGRGYSISRSTRISEIGSPGTKNEHVLSGTEEQGFLWRLNTCWTYEERDSGLYMQIESVSLTRSIPTGLGWVVKPFVESVPRESMEFTLRAICNALRK